MGSVLTVAAEQAARSPVTGDPQDAERDLLAAANELAMG